MAFHISDDELIVMEEEDYAYGRQCLALYINEQVSIIAEKVLIDPSLRLKVANRVTTKTARRKRRRKQTVSRLLKMRMQSARSKVILSES